MCKPKGFPPFLVVLRMREYADCVEEEKMIAYIKCLKRLEGSPGLYVQECKWRILEASLAYRKNESIRPGG